MSSLSYLRYRKNIVSSQIQSNRSLVSNVEEKIARLKKARSDLSSFLSNVRSTRNSINRLTISSTSWKGNSKTNFDKKYNRYKDSVGKYVKKIEDERNTINYDIQRYESQRSSYLSSISSLQQTLNSLNWQIRQAERGLG